MGNRHERVINSARELLSTIDRDEFIQELVKLQEQATGPTVEEFLSSFSISTVALFGLVNRRLFSTDREGNLSEQSSMVISGTIRDKAIDSFQDKNLELYETRDIISSYKLHGKAISNVSYEFQLETYKQPLCNAA